MYMWKNESKIGKIKRALLEKHRTKLWKTRHANIKMTVKKENKTKNIENAQINNISSYIKNIFPFYILTYLDIMNSSNEWGTKQPYL